MRFFPAQRPQKWTHSPPIVAVHFRFPYAEGVYHVTVLQPAPMHLDGMYPWRAFLRHPRWANVSGL